MLKIKRNSNQQDLKIAYLTSVLSNLNNFHSLEVVDRVSETQLQVSENLAVEGGSAIENINSSTCLLEK